MVKTSQKFLFITHMLNSMTHFMDIADAVYIRKTLYKLKDQRVYFRDSSVKI